MLHSSWRILEWIKASTLRIFWIRAKLNSTRDIVIIWNIVRYNISIIGSIVFSNYWIFHRCVCLRRLHAQGENLSRINFRDVWYSSRSREGDSRKTGFSKFVFRLWGKVEGVASMKIRLNYERYVALRNKGFVRRESRWIVGHEANLISAF